MSNQIPRPLAEALGVPRSTLSEEDYRFPVGRRDQPAQDEPKGAKYSHYPTPYAP